MRKLYHYVISASSAKDRREFMRKQFENKGEEPNFLEAIMGKDISPEDWKKWVVPDELLTLKKGEVGGGLSHLQCYKNLLASDKPYVFVFEDDSKITDEFFEAIDGICKYMDMQTDPVVLLLFNTFDTYVHKIGNIEKEIKVYRSLGGVLAAGYVINRKAAANLVRINTPIFIQADAWRTFVKAGLIDLRCLNKKLVYGDDYLASHSIIEQMESRNETSEANKVAQKKRKKALKYMYSKLTLSERLSALKSRALLHIRELYYDKN